VLRVDDLALTYPGADRAAVDGVSLAVPAGGCVALLGPSGCGKTTVLRMIAGLLPPGRGDVRVDGRSVVALPPERRGVVMVFQSALLFPTMTVAGNVGFGLRMRGTPAAEVATRVARMLDLVRLSGLEGRMPADLSGGQAQRVALARALVVKPKVLLLDEPIAHLDPALRAGMRDLIADLRAETGVTTVLVTHDPDDALSVADRAALMDNGRVVQDDTPATLMSRPADRRVAQFFGAANLFPGQVRAGAITCELGQLQVPGGLPDGPGILTFRPEAVVLADASGGLAATVMARRDLGDRIQVTFTVGQSRVAGQFRPDQAVDLNPGHAVRIDVPLTARWVMPAN
jgi:putative spermidine/putrescine transport system ATP-binding protein